MSKQAAYQKKTPRQKKGIFEQNFRFMSKKGIPETKFVCFVKKRHRVKKGTVSKKNALKKDISGHKYSPFVKVL